MNEKLTHAGGVVVRIEDGIPKVLLARAFRPPHDWVLPKGHLNPGETPEEGACREVREETGVDADIVTPLGDDRYPMRGENVVVRYYLMRFRSSGSSSEDREIKWCSLEEAERLLGFESGRAMVRAALQRRG